MFDASEQFSTKLIAIIEMINLIDDYKNDFGVIKEEYLSLSGALIESASILPVAFFEDFLRTNIEQFIDTLNNTEPRVEWEKLPLNLRKAHVFDTPLAYRKKPEDGNDERYQEQILQELKTVLGKILSPIENPSGYIIASESLTDTNSNPNSDTVQNMYSKIGINNIFNDAIVKEEMKAVNAIYDQSDRIKTKLNEVVQIRHGVAHGRGVHSLTGPQLIDNISFLKTLSVSIEKCIYSHLLVLSNQP